MKYKYALLIAMTLLSLNSFSQTGIKIQQVSNNDTVKIYKETAKKVAKDLVYLDALVLERVLLLENVDSLKSIKNYKDSIIVYKNKQISDYKDIIKIQQDKEKVYTNTIYSLKSDLKKQKLSSKITFGFAIVAVVFAVIK